MDAASGSSDGCHASNSRSLICVTCGGPVNPDSCHLLQHHIEDLTIGAQDSQALDPLYVSNVNPSDALSSTDMSACTWNSVSWLRSSGNATEWNTASTGLSSNSAMGAQSAAPFEMDGPTAPMECELPLTLSNLPQGSSNIQNLDHVAHGRPIDSRGQQPLTAEAEAHLLYLLERCKQEGRLPREREIHGLALCEEISADTVSAWFYRNFSQPQPTHSTNPHCGQDQSPEHASQNIPLSEEIVLQQVEEYARQKYSQDCSNPHSRKSAESGGKYKCTSGCGFSTNARDTWQRHEQLRQPQDFWYCIVCRSLGQVSAVCSRKNHLNQHLENCHKEIPKEDHNRFRDESKVGYQNGFERHCKFFNGTEPCQYRFRSWKDRIQHYLHHFNDKIRDGPWRLRFQGRRWFDDDDDKDGHDSGAGTSGSSGSGWSSNILSSSVPKSSQSGQQMQADSAYSYTLDVNIREAILPPKNGKFNNSRGDATALPSTLIDVATLSWQHATPQSKYVALDDSSTEHFALYKWAFTSPQNGDGLRDMGRMCAPFKELLSIVRNMGYSLLWIDKLCESEDDAQRARALYEQAVLTIVLVSSPQQANKISHYTCHYQNIEQVRTWAVQSLPILHVQNLGHGAFGIVDEVRVDEVHFGGASSIYARKMLLGPKAHSLRKAIQFREIEIMQKLRHQNIAQFVAAYFDHRSLNILMRPVAECSLRDFLVEPSKWAAKLRLVPRWMCSLASAVSYMHGLSLRHKDIKPANILIRGDDVYLSDFGAALDFSFHESGSEGDAIMTPRYCAPEVARRDYRGRKADIFSLGCVFLEIATVDRGRSLSDADRFLGHDAKNFGNKIAYCTSLKACGYWIDLLLEGTPSHYQCTSLNLCLEMLAHDPHDRPSALRVHDELMSACSFLPSTLCSKDLVVSGARSRLNVGATNDRLNVLVKHHRIHRVFRISDFGVSHLTYHKRRTLSSAPPSPLELGTDAWSFAWLLLECLVWTPRGSQAGGLTALPSAAEVRKVLLDFGPLPKHRDFRKLQIQLSKGFDALLECDPECDLVMASPDTNIHYQALSYCWESGKREHHNQCDEKVVLVKKNLLGALRHVKHGGLSQEQYHLWVDSICIDQDNPQENLQQIELMIETFARAESTITWLEGPPQMEKSWATRMWTIQERLLARNTTMLISCDYGSEKWASVATQNAADDWSTVPWAAHGELRNSARTVKRNPLDNVFTEFNAVVLRLVFGTARVREEFASDHAPRLSDKVTEDAEFEDSAREAFESMYQKSDVANLWLRKMSGWS